MSALSVTSFSQLSPAVSANIKARAGYVDGDNGRLRKDTVFGSETLARADRNVRAPTSNAKFNAERHYRTKHLGALAFIDAKSKLPDGTKQQLCGRIPTPHLTDEQLRKIGESKAMRDVHYSLDKMVDPKTKKALAKKTASADAESKPDATDQPKVTGRKWLKQKFGKARENLKPTNIAAKAKKIDRNTVAGALARGADRLSSIGDAVNAVTTITVNTLSALSAPTKDGDSAKHSAVRVLFSLPALAILFVSSFSLRSLVNRLDPGNDAKLLDVDHPYDPELTPEENLAKANEGDFKVTQAVGWYWWAPAFQGVALVAQAAACAIADESQAVSLESVKVVEDDTSDIITKLSNMINGIRGDTVAENLLIEGLNRSVSAKYRLNNKPKVWLKLKAAETPAQVEKAIAEYLTTEEPGGDKRLSRFNRERHLLKLMKLAENSRTEGCGSKEFESARLKTERVAAEANNAIGMALAKVVYRASRDGEIKSVAKMARWIEKHSESSNKGRRIRDLSTPEGRYAHRYHPLMIKENGGPVSKALVNIGFFLRDFGRNYILSADTNLARVIRYTVQHLYENITGRHASMTMCHTFGMLTGWLIVGTALTALSGGLELALGPAAVALKLMSSGAGMSVGFVSLTFAYAGFAALGGLFMLAGMGLAWAGL